MKKIIGLVGSLRKDSLNRQVFNHYKELSFPNLDLNEGEISDIPPYNEDCKEIPNSVSYLSEQILNSDAVLFFSPEYNYSVPGQLKNTLDWLSRQSPLPLDGKKASIIGASPGNVGTARMQYHLRQIGVFLNIDFLNKPEIMISNAHKKIANNRVTHSETLDHLKKHIEIFTKFVIDL